MSGYVEIDFDAARKNIRAGAKSGRATGLGTSIVRRHVSYSGAAASRRGNAPETCFDRRKQGSDDGFVKSGSNISQSIAPAVRNEEPNRRQRLVPTPAQIVFSDRAYDRTGLHAPPEFE